MRRGRVHLVGAGPGDPGLLTIRGRRVLGRAEVVVYDRLVDPRVLALAPRRALRVFAGKAPGHPTLPQEEITALLIAHAERGRRVVRLKGGDPFVFGRGGEEAEALAARGVRFQVVPGVSAAVAVPASAGIPLTYRRLASSFAVVTGHAADDAAEPDWARLATATDTLVVLMGLTRLPRIVAALLAHGRARSTPAAVIEQGTTPAQRTIVGTLGTIVTRVERAAVAPPAVIVIGAVVALRDHLAGRDQERRRRARRREAAMSIAVSTVATAT